MRRIVVTGLGIVCPLGVGVDNVWDRIVAGKSGIRKITEFPTDDLKSKIAGMVPIGETSEGLYCATDWSEPKEIRKNNNFINYAVAAAKMAFDDCGFTPESDEQRERSGVLVGSGIGGLTTIADGAVDLATKGAGRISPFFIPSALINLASGQISIKYGLRGPNHSVVTACATGTHAIGDAARLIQHGDADFMVAGGSEAAISHIGIGGFCAARALSTAFNDRPEQASRPWDRDRDGFVMGDGAGIIILEELEHAKKRGAKIYAEYCGYGLSGDAHHITAPAADGNGGYRAMRSALNDAKMDASQIDYVNAHGTSTPLGDDIELGAVERLFGAHCDNLKMSSTKSSIGHLLGATGAVEAIFALKSLVTGIIPPTLNLENPSRETKIDLVPLKAIDAKIKAILSNSFGFGGTNASIIFREFN